MSDKIRKGEEIIEELENCFLGQDEYILDLLSELKKSRDEEVQRLEAENKEKDRIIKLGRDLLDQQYLEYEAYNKKLRKAVKEFLDWWSFTNQSFLVVVKNLQQALEGE